MSDKDDSAKKNDQDAQKEKQENELEEKLKECEDKWKRAVADYRNLEKRTSEERREWVVSGNKSLIEKLLPVLDILFLAQKHNQNEGLDLSIQKFLDVLRDEGVERIETLEKEFDPNTMECVSVQDGEENKILEELRPGFMLNGKVIRPAQVIVGGKN